MKRKELLQRDDDDGDSMLSSATSDTSSTKRKRFALCHIVLVQRYVGTLLVPPPHVEIE